MKLATFRDGSRDGVLAVVSRDLTKSIKAETIIPRLRTLQQLMDDWPNSHHKVTQIYADLSASRSTPAINDEDFESSHCAAPLPRAYQWADGSAYVNHVELVCRARAAEMPASFWTEPLMYQGGSDTFLGPCDDMEVGDEAWGIDLRCCTKPANRSSAPSTRRWCAIPGGEALT